MRTTTKLLLPMPLVAALALAGCAGGSDAGADTAAAETISIVASTNVYGDIAAQIGGDLVEVTSIIEGSTQDPHSYEATARDQLAVSEADIVIENGGGYDGFIDTLLEDAPDAHVLSAVDISGLAPEDGETEEHDHDHDHADETGEASAEATAESTEDDHDHEGHAHIEGFNEHVWYDVHTIEHLAEELTAELSELDADNASTYEQNSAAFLADLDEVHERLHGLEELGGGDVLVTEPVPLYMLEGAGLTNVTPDAFTEAVEEGDDISPASLQEVLDLIAGGGIRLLGYNDQTESAETEQVREAAEAASVPVVNFTETLPDGDTYVSWMTANVDAIEAALS